ncbi:unannotated protein [freshwater metagenome]|jgi:hypothetical protein|uniref:Unannotated protein n=1 Tax=freshwater metagenome TaxID=449393 RepID=A0A6J6ZDU5_9ZZZZ|nr:hypothetical protein [Actinomycetota bacterium]
MLKYLIVLVIIIDIYTLIDCAMTPQEKVRRFPKWAWLLIIILTGIIGDIAWFVAGRPKRPRPNRGGNKRIIPPDDNPDFLRKL